jgi:CBS domain-containing protein
MLPVVDRQGRILGVVAEGDLLARDAEAELVRDVMRHLTVLVHPETDVREADRLLLDHGVKSLPVVDAADQVVGVVSRSDIVRLFARDDAQLQQEIVDALCLAGVRGWRVAVHNGVVDLCGPHGAASDEAVGTARATLGVRAVRVS